MTLHRRPRSQSYSLRLLAALALSCVAPASQATDGARLVYADHDGGVHAIAGFQTSHEDGGTSGGATRTLIVSRPFYQSKTGETVVLPNLSSLRVSASKADVDQLAVVPRAFCLKQPPENPLIQKPNPGAILYNVDLEVLARENWAGRDVDKTLYATLWIRGEEISTLFVSTHPETRTLSLGFGERVTIYSLAASRIGNVGVEIGAASEEIDGYPAVVAFVDGVPISPKEDALRPPSFFDAPDHTTDKRDRASLLLVAARCGFDNYIRANLDPRDSKLVARLLHNAVSNGRTSTAQLLFDFAEEFDWRPKPPPQHRGSTLQIDSPLEEDALTEAALRGHTATLLLALNRLAKPLRPRESEELVYRTFFRTRFETGKALLDRGYSFGKLDQSSLSRLAMIFVGRNRLDLIPLIDPTDSLSANNFSLGTATTIFHKVAPFADIELLDYLHKKGVPHDEENEASFTPLILAAGYSNIPAVCWFLDHGARIDHQNNRGHTALQYSIVKQQHEAATCLLQRGSDVNFLGPKGVTPLMQAILFRDPETAAAIREAGGIWNLDSEYLSQCLDLALQQDDLPSLELALAQGLSPTTRVLRKWPLPWLAAYYQASSIAQALGVEPRIKTESVSEDLASLSIASFDSDRVRATLERESLPPAIQFQCFVSPKGDAFLPLIIGENVDRFLDNELRLLIASFTFELGPLAADSSAFVAKFELPLSNGAMPFPRNARLLSLAATTSPLAD